MLLSYPHPSKFVWEMLPNDDSFSFPSFIEEIGGDHSLLINFLQEKAPLTNDLALRFAKFFNTSLSRWTYHQSQYERSQEIQDTSRTILQEVKDTGPQSTPTSHGPPLDNNSHFDTSSWAEITGEKVKDRVLSKFKQHLKQIGDCDTSTNQLEAIEDMALRLSQVETILETLHEALNNRQKQCFSFDESLMSPKRESLFKANSSLKPSLNDTDKIGIDDVEDLLALSRLQGKCEGYIDSLDILSLIQEASASSDRENCQIAPIDNLLTFNETLRMKCIQDKRAFQNTGSLIFPSLKDFAMTSLVFFEEEGKTTALSKSNALAAIREALSQREIFFINNLGELEPIKFASVKATIYRV